MLAVPIFMFIYLSKDFRELNWMSHCYCRPMIYVRLNKSANRPAKNSKFVNTQSQKLKNVNI